MGDSTVKQVDRVRQNFGHLALECVRPSGPEKRRSSRARARASERTGSSLAGPSQGAFGSGGVSSGSLASKRRQDLKEASPTQIIPWKRIKGPHLFRR